MDIPKYIGLYLLKKQSCYIHGLGNLELKKISSTYDSQSLTGPSYEVVLTQSGSIDDNFANFIATSEQISISKASNTLRDFSTQSRIDLHSGKEVIIPAIGKFIEKNSVLQFITDPHLQYTPPSIPILRTSRRAEQDIPTPSTFNTPKIEFAPPDNEVKQSKYSGATVNWGRVALLGGILLLIIVGIAVGIYYFTMQRGPAIAPPKAMAMPFKDTTPAVQTMPAAPPVDTTHPAIADTTKSAVTNAATIPPQQAPAKPTAAPAPSGPMIQYKVVLNTYENQAKAERRLAQLKGFKHNVELVKKDSAKFLIIMPVSSAATDSSKMLDSLRRTFNPKGVSVYK
jgi:hypothetical protein